MPQLTIQYPTPNQIVAAGEPLSVDGVATDPVSIDSVTVAVDNQPPIAATLKIIPRQPLTTVDFVATVQVSNVPGQHTIVVKATNNSGISATKSVTVLVADAAAKLQRISITFNTHNDNLNNDTVLHVFVKNRRSAKLRGDSASTSLATTGFIDNKLAFDQKASEETSDFNPFLGFGENLTGGQSLENNSTHTFDIPVRAPIPLEEVGLPIVNIHILPNGNDQWIFDYTITFTFDDGRSFSSSSNANGVTGIILDQDNMNYAGLCVENPFVPLPDAPKPDTDAVLIRLVLEFATHDGDDNNKDHDTKVNVHVVNRLSATASQDISVANDVLSGVEFAPKSSHPVDLPLASRNIRLQDIVLPVFNINIGPNGNDRWAFDYRMTFLFEESDVLHEPFSSTTPGVILDQDNHKHTGVYSGRGFPTLASPPAGLSPHPIDRANPPKSISLSYVQKKFDAFINNRNQLGTDTQFPPIFMVRLDHTQRFGAALPESYYDIRSIVADPPAPRSVEPPEFRMPVTYNSSPTSLGQLSNFFSFGDVYLNDINSQSLKAGVGWGWPNSPIGVSLDFETVGGIEVIGGTSQSVGQIDLTQFTITVPLTLQFAKGQDPQSGRVDLMAETEDDLLRIDAEGQALPGVMDIFKSTVKDKLFARLTTPDGVTGVTPKDALNASINSWLLGGVIQTGNPYASIGMQFPNVCTLADAKVVGDKLMLSYIGPPKSFVYQSPADWPSAAKPNPNIDFSPGTLASIDHIVVLTMENRSFDQMLGYLSLPESMGGLARQDVDGLKGGEFNMLNGQKCPIFPFRAGETIFAPDPPHDTEPVLLAINGGKMDGFAQSYANLRGNAVGPNIMGYHTAATVPVYDALARDFAIVHRWFAPHPGPTFCNRFYELTGRLNIDPWGFWEYSNSSPLRPVFTDTIFDNLSEQSVSWTYFEHYYCFLRFFERHTFDATNVASFDDPIFGFEALAKAGKLPSVCFIDPHFVELPPDGNCDGPPADVKEGQKLVKRVVEAVVASPNWDKTLLIIIYDEHGGFFDHVPPPPAAKVAPELVDTYGVRVPAFVISPWVGAGTVFGYDGATVAGGGGSNSGDASRFTRPGADLHYDHTSILKTIARRFLSTNPPYMGARYAAANDLSVVLGTQPRQPQFLPFIRYRLQFVASGMMLDVQLANPAPGTVLQQLAADGSVEQDFSFEDAGGGFVYIRSQVSNLYVTVPSAGTALTGGGAATNGDAGSGSSNTANASGLIQDVKYTPRQIGSSIGPSPALQLWKLTSASLSPLERDLYVISNQEYPTLILQPANPSQSQSLIVLGPADGGTGDTQHTQKSWKITSPLFSGGTTNA